MNKDYEEYKKWVLSVETDELKQKICRMYFNNYIRSKDYKANLNVDGFKINKLNFAKFLFDKTGTIAIQLDYNKYFKETNSYMVSYCTNRLTHPNQYDIHNFNRDKEDIIEYLRELKLNKLLT